MAKLKKLSKSEPTQPGFEVFPHDRRDGARIWLWACDQGCYDDTPYDRASRTDAERTAQRHTSKPHG